MELRDCHICLRPDCGFTRILRTLSTDSNTKVRTQWLVLLFLVLGLGAVRPISAATVTVDCDAGGAVGRVLNSLEPGDVLLVQGACRENILIQAQFQHITLDGQRKATINAVDPGQPAIQVLGREITIKGFTVIGGSFGVAINRGATAVIDGNAIENAAITGLEVSQNSFARIVNNTIERSGRHGIYVLGSASAHIGVISTGDTVAQPNVIQNNGVDGIQVLRASTARIIGNTISGNQRNGLTVQQASHADVAGNTFNRNLSNGILVVGNSGMNLADSAMRLFEQPNTTTAPNGMFGIRCEIGAYVEGPLGSLTGSTGVKNTSDKSCIDRSSR
jgi:parallel beta-helix repeat protein